MALTKVTGQVIKNTTDVTVGVLTVTNTLAVGGTVSIGGTLTYEDVTNVDAVGLITARNGIVVGSGITLSVDGDIFATGVCTATSFVGSGANLTGVASTENLRTNTNATFLQNINVSGSTTTGSLVSSGAISGTTGTFTGDVSIADKIVHTGDTNTAIRFSGADTIKLETSGTERFQVDSSGNIYVGGVGGSATAGTLWFNDTSANASKIAQSNGNSALTFHTGSSQPERARIDSSGRLGIGTASGTRGLNVEGTGNAARAFFNDSSNHKAVEFGADSNGSFQSTIGANPHLIYTNGTEKVRITSAGKIGIGLDSPNCLLHIQDAAISGYSSQSGTLLAVEDTGDTSIEIASGHNNTGSIFFGDTGSSNKGQVNYHHGTGGDMMSFYTNGDEQLRITSDGKIGFNYAATPPSEDIMICTDGQASEAGVSLSHLSGGNRYGLRLQTISGTNAGITFSPLVNSSYNEGMRIQYSTALSSTKVGIGNVDPPYPLTVQYAGNNDSNAAVSRFYQLTNNQGEDHACFLVRHAAATSGQNGVGLLFQNTGGTTVGKIDFGHSTTQYRTSSDYRLKENDVKITDGITRIKQLRPIRFNFIAEPDKTVDGFFAHEAAVAVPEAVSGTKDEVDSDNNPIIQGLDHSKLVPLLTAALQEAVTKIEVLATEVEQLKSQLNN